MKFIKNTLRIWLTVTSLGAFTAGWAMLAHAGKPVSPASTVQAQLPAPLVEPLPTLAPIPEFNARQPRQIQIQPAPFSSVRPQFRTGGS